MAKLKVRDRVAVYGGIPGTSISCCGKRGTVTFANSEQDFIEVTFDDRLGGMASWGVHRKQCYRLIKKKKAK
jgi:hypothetical protein